jgi:hypothetical protein
MEGVMGRLQGETASLVDLKGSDKAFLGQSYGMNIEPRKNRRKSKSGIPTTASTIKAQPPFINTHF